MHRHPRMIAGHRAGAPRQAPKAAGEQVVHQPRALARSAVVGAILRLAI